MISRLIKWFGMQISVSVNINPMIKKVEGDYLMGTVEKIVWDTIKEVIETQA